MTTTTTTATMTIEDGYNIDIYAWRNGYKWTINECLQLEREYDLLKLSVPEMAILHSRTINAIMCKLQEEELDTFNNLFVKTFGQVGDQVYDQECNQVGDQECNQECNQVYEQKCNQACNQECNQVGDQECNQINKLNNLSSLVDEVDEDLDEDLDDDLDEDLDEDEDDEDDEDDEEDDEDYKKEVEYNDASNRAYVFDNIKRIKTHITNMFGYFTRAPSETVAI